jgi:pilus assembly protein CpaB
MQNRRGFLFIALALVMGLGAAWIATRLTSSPAAARTAPLKTTPVVVARADVPVASSLMREQLDTVDWPSRHVPNGAIQSVDQAVDRIVRRPIASGEPVLEAALFDPGASGGLRAVISPEHRAVSVKVDNVIGVAGFVTPGARVDVLATIRRVDLARPLPYAKVILQDVRVLAVDQKLEEVKSGDPELVSVVTLEVDPMQAEHLIYAAHEGRLQLALRSPGDDEQVATRSISVADVLGGKQRVKSAKIARAPSRPRTAVQVIKGSKLEVKTF